MYGEEPKPAAAMLNQSSNPASNDEGQPEDRNIQAIKDMKMHQIALDNLSKSNLLPQESSTEPMTPAQMSSRAPTPQGVMQTHPDIPPTPAHLDKILPVRHALNPIMMHYLRNNLKSEQ